MSGPANSRAESAFTLIEMLSVIAIIVLLIGLLFPAAHLVQESAKRRQAQQQARALVQAIKQYRTAYGRWPGQTQGGYDFASSNCAALLCDLTNNPRNISFLGSLDNIVVDNGFLDPWNQPFLVGIDEDSDGKLSLSCPGGHGSITATVPVAVMSTGPEPGNLQKGIYSWTP